MSLLQDFDEFFNFCFKHGRALKGHWEFGQMANELRAKIVASQNVCPECGSYSKDDCGCGEYCKCYFVDAPLTFNTIGRCERCGKLPLR